MHRLEMGFWKQQWHFVELRPQPSGHLDVHLGEAKLSVSLQNFDELSSVPWRLQPMHNDLLAAGYRAQHCAWVQCVGVVVQNSSTSSRRWICTTRFLVCTPQAFYRRQSLVPLQARLSAFRWPPSLEYATPGRLFCSACPARYILLRSRHRNRVFK